MQEKRSRPTQERRDIATVVWLSLGILGPILVSLAFALAEVGRNQQALRWLSTSGQVTYSAVNEVYDAVFERTSPCFRVYYEYQVDGERLRGSRSLGPWSRDTAQKWVQAYPPGSGVRVYYNPRNPKRSTVWPEVQAQWTLSRVQELVPFFLVILPGVGLLALLVWLRLHAPSSRPAPAAEGKVLRRW
jgi:hypothetical protein